MDRNIDQRLSKIDPTIPNTSDPRNLRSVDFRPYQRQEGNAVAKPDDENETAISLALKRAKAKKREKREAKVAARLVKLRVKRPTTAPERKAKVPTPAPKSDVALQVSSQQYLQETRDREERSRKIARIALGREPLKPAAERSPPPPPTGPDDPRIQNGSLAPSPRVAERLKNLLPSESVSPIAERPLQTAPFPTEWQDILERGSMQQILAGRKLADLRGSDREAYYRARERAMKPIITAPRRRESKRRTPLWSVVNELRFIQGWTMQQLGEKCDLTLSQLRDTCISGDGPDARLTAIAGAFGLTLDEFKSMIADETPSVEAPAPEATPVEDATAKRTWGTNMTPEERADHFHRMAHRSAEKRRAKEQKAQEEMAPEVKPRPNEHPRQGKAAVDRLSAPHDGDTPFQASLRALMRERHLSGAEMAKRSGLNSDMVLALLRNGRREPSYRTIRKLCAGLNVTEDRLLGKAPLQDAVAAAVAIGIHAGREIDPESAPLAPVGPKVKIEKGVPLPQIFLRAEMYRWDELEKGDSFVAETPFGMSWSEFRVKFQRMANRYSDQLGHWYTTEEDEAKETIRLWRII